jgi:hypothetical protein
VSDEPQRTPVKSRRAVLAAAAGAGAALVANGLAGAAPVNATTGPMQYGTSNISYADATNLNSTNSVGTLMVANSGSGHAIYAEVNSISAAIHAEASGGVAIEGHGFGSAFATIYGVAENGVGVVGDTATVVKGGGYAGVWGRDLDTTGRMGVAGTTDLGTGVAGFSGGGAALPAPAQSVAAAPEPTGVLGYAPDGVGVRAQSDTGTALKVSGKTHFSRSGRATVGAGKSYVDVVVAGGVAATSLCFANLAAYRAGVYVAAVRSAYPTTAKIRIYLNKAVVKATVVAWLVSD